MDISHKDRDSRRPEQETVEKASGVHGTSCPDCAIWQAHAEALAGVLEQTVKELEAVWGTSELDGPPYRTWTLPNTYALRARTALARLPAQALAERRALERCAAVLPRVLEPDNDPVPAQREARNALGALDAARREGRT